MKPILMLATLILLVACDTADRSESGEAVDTTLTTLPAEDSVAVERVHEYEIREDTILNTREP